MKAVLSACCQSRGSDAFCGAMLPRNVHHALKHAPGSIQVSPLLVLTLLAYVVLTQIVKAWLHHRRWI
jgi:hypothetical protein